MMIYSPKVMPVEIFPADWCSWCDHPGHGTLEACNILCMRHAEGGQIVVVPCGCTDNIVIGKQGDYILRVTRVQKE